ncbi:MAG: magnesium/cobalt transporter CorA [Gemmatimonadetes bacterium]|nr:magnesium/cobalt transporter CorA [Gemmatimonadota bacterium]
MSRFVPRLGYKKAGSPPGTLVHVGERKVDRVTVSYFDYDADALREVSDADIEQCFERLSEPTVTWVNVWGLHDVDLIRTIAERTKLHPLIVEDILDTNQRAKVEEYDGALYVVLRMLSQGEEGAPPIDEQVSLVLGSRFVLSFQERLGDVFEPVRERIRTGGGGNVRKRGADYLAYALVDAVVDRYFESLEVLGDQIETVETQVLDEDASPEALGRIQELRRSALIVRRAVWPLREVIGSMYRTDSELIAEDTRIFLRDVHDHAVQVIDAAETLRELAAGVMDLHMSAVSNRMNEVMKVLTMIATIFIPLSFLAGLYGMNFDTMPELHIPWAYPALLSVMGAVGIGMLVYFKRKGWW